jgi:hypothetical protein
VANVTRRPPSSGDDRALAGLRARTPAAGVPVVDPLARTVEDLPQHLDDVLTPPPVMVAELRSQLQSRGDLNVEHLEMAEAIAERVMQSVLHMHQLQSNRLMQVAQAAPGSEHSARRLAELETWKREMIEWRLKLSGVDDRNGRLGRMDQAFADLRCDLEAADKDLRKDMEAADAAIRKDIGSPEEAATVRQVAGAVKSIGKRTWVAITAAVLAAGGGGYGVLTRDQARDAAVRADARMEVRLEVVEQGFLRLVERVDRIVSRGRSAAPDPDQPARNP